MYKENRPEAPASTGEKIDKFLHGAAVFMFGKDSLIRHRAFVLTAAATACVTGFLALSISSPHELSARQRYNRHHIDVSGSLPDTQWGKQVSDMDYLLLPPVRTGMLMNVENLSDVAGWGNANDMPADLLSNGAAWDTATKLLLADDDSKGVVPQFGTIVFARGDDGSLKVYDVREPNLPEDVQLFEVSRYGGMGAFSPAYVQGETPSMDRLRIVVNGMVVLENPHLYHDAASSEMTATP